MNVTGFTFIRNGVKYDYPFLESLRSLLPLCDEVIVVAGRSEDDTLERIQSLHEPRIRIIETVWDDSLRTGGAILAQQTNVALDHVTGDWGFYLQGDEVLHEQDAAAIRSAMEQHRTDPRIEGLLFRYTHFFGSYAYIGASRRWYRREVRIVRPGIGVRSWGDAQGFRIDGRKLKVVPVPATVYHYGWVKPPAVQQLKQKTFNKYWHDDAWVQEHVAPTAEYDYSEGGRLIPFRGTHPAVMNDRVAKMDWQFVYDPKKAQQRLRESLLDRVEDLTGWRIGEYRNYTLL